MDDSIIEEYVRDMTPIWQQQDRIEKAKWKAMRNQLKQIKLLLNRKMGDIYFLKAQKMLYTALLPFENELKTGVELEEFDRDSIRQAGELLYKKYGMEGLYYLLPSCPDRVHPILNIVWHGIGEWRA